MIYRIVTNKGHVDTAFDLELAEHKFKMYVRDMSEGQSKFVNDATEWNVWKRRGDKNRI